MRKGVCFENLKTKLKKTGRSKKGRSRSQKLLKLTLSKNFKRKKKLGEAKKKGSEGQKIKKLPKVTLRKKLLNKKTGRRKKGSEGQKVKNCRILFYAKLLNEKKTGGGKKFKKMLHFQNPPQPFPSLLHNFSFFHFLYNSIFSFLLSLHKISLFFQHLKNKEKILHKLSDNFWAKKKIYKNFLTTFGQTKNLKKVVVTLLGKENASLGEEKILQKLSNNFWTNKKS